MTIRRQGWPQRGTILAMSRHVYKGKLSFRQGLLLMGLVIILAFFFSLLRNSQNAGYATAQVVKVSTPEANAMVTNVNLKVISGPMKGQLLKAPILVEQQSLYRMDLNPGDEVVIVTEKVDGRLDVGIDEYYRAPTLLFFIALVAILLVLIGRWQGLVSFLALAITILLVFGGLANLLLLSYSPLPMAIIFSAIITFITLALIGGFTKKTLTATLGTVGGVSAAGFFAYLATVTMHLSGVTGHEAIYLQTLSLSLDFRGLLLCAIIIGALGAVMDICMSLATSLEELSKADKTTTYKSLFHSGMKMGSDLLGTMTNTLVLAYAGSSLTLILLLSAQRAEFPLARLLNMEFITVEIVRSLAGLFGMACAIPISAAVGAYLYGQHRRRPRRVTQSG